MLRCPVHFPLFLETTRCSACKAGAIDLCVVFPHRNWIWIVVFRACDPAEVWVCLLSVDCMTPTVGRIRENLSAVPTAVPVHSAFPCLFQIWRCGVDRKRTCQRNCFRCLTSNRALGETVCNAATTSSRDVFDRENLFSCPAPNIRVPDYDQKTDPPIYPPKVRSSEFAAKKSAVTKSTCKLQKSRGLGFVPRSGRCSDFVPI